MAGKTQRRSTLISWGSFRFPNWCLNGKTLQMIGGCGVVEDGGFLGGRGGEWQAVVAGIKDLRRFISTGNHFSVILYGRGSSPWKKVCFHEKGFLRRRHISMEEGFFYRGGVFLQWRLIFMAEAAYYSMERAYFCEKVNLKAIGLLLVWKKRNQCVAQRSVYVQTALF